jgi:hypothetical protein
MIKHHTLQSEHEADYGIRSLFYLQTGIKARFPALASVRRGKIAA